MAEYIEREVLLNDLRGSYDDLMQIYKGLNYDEEKQICSAELGTFLECILRVKDAPAADVVEVVHGTWEDAGHGLVYKCSECGDLEDIRLSKFCPECGARMDGDG